METSKYLFVLGALAAPVLGAGCAADSTPEPAPSAERSVEPIKLPASSDTTARTGIVAWQLREGDKVLHVVGLDAAGKEVTTLGVQPVVERKEMVLSVVTDHLESMRLDEKGAVVAGTLSARAVTLMQAAQADVQAAKDAGVLIPYDSCGWLGGIAVVTCFGAGAACASCPASAVTCPACPGVAIMCATSAGAWLATCA